MNMMAPRIVECRSPNHDERPQGAAIDMLVLHYTGMKTSEEALSRLCDPEARVSAHYTIDRDGRVYRHVPEERRAWHAGVSYWAGERNINGCSIGIELVNPGHEFGYEPFARPQIAALLDLAGDIVERHRIPPARVVGHSDVAPARKEDPGELFPWQHLAEFGIGMWPFAERAALVIPHSMLSPASECGKESIDEQSFAQALKDFGYGTAPDVDVPLAKVVTAFQRHWRPSRVDGVIDEETAYRLGRLLDALS
jgi:N-acetylmuramoyl-L-alanine amidase